MPEIDLRPWAPHHMVVEVLSTRPAAPRKPTAQAWLTVELVAGLAIHRASLTSRLMSDDSYKGGADNG